MQPIPPKLSNAVAEVQRAGGDLVVRLLQDLLPRCRCPVVSLLAIGAGPVGVHIAQSIDLDLVAVCEPWGAPMADTSPLEGGNLSIYQNVSDLAATGFAHEFCLLAAPHLLLWGQAAGQGRDLPALLRHLLEVVVAPGGGAVLGAPREAGPLHEFLAALNPGYFTADALRAVASSIPGITVAAEVEHTEELWFASGEGLADVLRLYAYLVRPQGSGAASVEEEQVQRAVALAARGLAGGVLLPVEAVYFVVQKAAVRGQLVAGASTNARAAQGLCSGASGYG